MNLPRLSLFAVAFFSFLTGAGILVAPQRIYEAVPGLALMGPFNVHFLRDVGLAYLAAGALLSAGGFLIDRRLALAGSLWLLLHAIFHLQIWSHRGFPLDYIFGFDLFAVISPAVFAVSAALCLFENAEQQRPSN